MKRLLHYFICVLIVMPSLACAMPCATDMNYSNTMGSEHNVMSEPSHNMANSTTKVNELMLLIDCINCELDKPSDTTKLKQPLYNSYPVVNTALNNLLNEPLQFSELNILMWPPPWANVRSLSPPLILTTQRFRI